MAQHDYVIANGTGAAVRSDLNNALAAIVSNNSGATEPTTTYAYQWWPDTTTGLLKIRNAANNAWVTVGTLASANLGLLASGGTLVSALGSASTPGITFTGDLNTGIYSPGADQVSIATGGSDRVSVDANGNVTINAQGDLRFADSDSSNWVAFQAPGTVATNVTWTLPDADGTSGQALTTNGSGTLSWASAAAAKISVGNTEAEVVDTGVDGHFKVTIEGTEALRVDASQRLLVGTSTSASINPSNLGTIAPLLQIAGSGSSSTAAASLQIIDTANSDIGVGASIQLTKDPGSTTLSSGWALGGIFFNGEDTSFVPKTGASIVAQADLAWNNVDCPTRLVFSTTADNASSPTERMRITSDGGLLVNRTSRFTTAAKVEIEGSGAATTAALPLAINDSLGTASGSSYSVVFCRVGIIVGSITTTASATAFNTSSDYRLKENLVPLTGAIDRLQQIPVHRFNFIADPDKTVDGFIAHEAQEIVPECVTGEKDAVDDDGNPVYQGIDQSKLVPLLTAALQEAIAEIGSLKDRVAALEAQ